MSGTSRSSQWCPSVTALGILSAIGWGLFADAGVHPSTWAISLSIVSFVSILFGLCTRMVPAIGHVGQLARSLVLTLFSLAVLQLIPLPLSVIRAISPQRAALVSAVSVVVPGDGWSPLSVTPFKGLLELTTLMGCLLVFVLVRESAGSHFLGGWIFTLPLIAGGLLEAILGLRQASNPHGPATATGTFLNRNHLAGFLELILPFALMAGWSVWRSRSREIGRNARLAFGLLCLGIAFTLMDAVLYTYSRMGLLTVCFVVFLTVAVSAWPSLRRSSKNVVRFAATLLGLGLALTALIPTRLSDRFQKASEIDRISTGFRVGFWRDTVSLAKDFWVAGCGLGCFESAYPRYQQTADNYRVEFTHNDYLQAAAELGTPGLLALILLSVVVARKLWAAAGPGIEDERRFFAAACFSSVCGMMLHSLVDFNLHIPANEMTFAYIAGLAFSNGSFATVRETDPARLNATCLPER